MLLIALAYHAACAVARWTVNSPRSLVPDFVLSLVPIAFVYVVAHYATLFLLQGQYTVPLLSDPLGRGWDLFGTAHVQPEPHADLAEHDLVRPGRPRSSRGTWRASRSPTTAR